MTGLNSKNRGDLPRPLPQFSHIKRYPDKADGTLAVAKILPGEYFVTENNEIITTVLGSCISVCAYDPGAKIGGMNHFMLPIDGQEDDMSSDHVTRSARYGNYAMELMINDILLIGGRRNKLEFKVFGGAKILENGANIGEQNIKFIQSFLKNEGFSIASFDVGASFPRKVKFFAESGRAQIKRLPNSRVNEIVNQEAKLTQQAEPTLSDHGDIELF